MAGLENFNTNDPNTWGSRGDGTTKGTGFFGILPANNGRIVTEYGMGFDYDGKEIEVPLINPYQSQAQILEVLQGKQPTMEMLDNARRWGADRLRSGKSPFIENNEKPYNLSDHKGLEGVRSQQ